MFSFIVDTTSLKALNQTIHLRKIKKEKEKKPSSLKISITVYIKIPK